MWRYCCPWIFNYFGGGAESSSGLLFLGSRGDYAGEAVGRIVFVFEIVSFDYAKLLVYMGA